MMVVSISNQKGGSGKSTTAVNLSAYMGLAGKRVLLIDLVHRNIKFEINRLEEKRLSRQILLFKICVMVH